MKFGYRIQAQIARLHSNPPIFNDIHPHQFTVVLQLEADRKDGELYGLNMCDIEAELNQVLSSLPQYINDHPLIPNGTTEQFCEWLSKELKFLPITQIEVAECPERVTILRCM